MWSKFYYKRKHYGYIYAFLSTLPYLLRACIKILIFIRNPQQKEIYCAKLAAYIMHIFLKFIEPKMMKNEKNL